MNWIRRNMGEKWNVLRISIIISAAVHGLIILIYDLPQILLNEPGSHQELQAISRLTMRPFVFLMSTLILYFLIFALKQRKSKK